MAGAEVILNLEFAAVAEVIVQLERFLDCRVMYELVKTVNSFYKVPPIFLVVTESKCFNIDLVAFLKICMDVEAFIKSESLLSFF